MRTIDAIQAVNDAAALAAVLMPLIQSAVQNNDAEISDADVQAARDKLETSVAALDRLISDLGPNG